MRMVMLLLLLAVQPLAASTPQAGELLTNASFEIDADADGTPDGWAIGPREGSASARLDGQVAHTGRRSIRLEGDPRGRVGLSVAFGPDVTEATAVYLLSAWVKVAGTSAHELRTSARVTSVDQGGEVLKSDYRLCAAGPHDWRYYEWLVSLPAGARRFNLVLFHHGAGTAWWDDVSLRKAQPLKALAPPQDATVRERRPEFRWETVPGRATFLLAPEGDFSPAKVRSYRVAGGYFRPRRPLATGKHYHWRVLITRPDGGLSVAMAADSSGVPAETARFWAGTWEQRMEPLRKELEAYREVLAPLRALAERNRMWDTFSLLARAIEQGEALVAREPADPGKARAELDAILSELEYTIPWWRRVFLDDAALFEGLDLSLPALADVRAAVARKDWPAARAALLQYYRSRKRPSYYARHEEAPVRSPGVTTQAAAEQLLTHKMDIHSYKEPTFDLGPDFNWHVHPIVDIEWPTKIHRCFHWSTLAAAYWQTGNERYAAEIAQQLLDWAKDNPMERWDPERRRWSWSTLNATIRIYSSWVDSWLQIRDSPAWTADAQFVFLAALREHGRFLMTHAATQGNWVVAEARGLVELGIMFPEFKEARAWREEGYRRLQRELAVQVLSDGIHVERTPGYHQMTLDCFMRPVQLGLLNGVDVPGREEFVRKLEQMHEFYLYGSKPNHRMEQIGDSGMMSADGQLRRGWEMFRREDMRWVLTDGKEGRPPLYRSYAFRAAGLYVSRSAWNDPAALWSILDWGGFLGHCHDDMGQLSLYAYGTELLIDTGIYSYAWPMRAPFHDTSGHNTVMVDGKTQKRRDPLRAHWVSTAHFDVFHGTTDNSEPLIHERTMAFRQPNEAGPGYWLVVDRLTGEGKHRLDQRWHATERLSGRVEGSTVILTGKPGGEPQPSLAICGLPQAGLQAALVEGAVSYAWYVKIPVDVAQFTLEREMPATLVTLLYPTPPGPRAAQVSLAPQPAELGGGPGAATAVAATIRDRGREFRDLWLVNHTGQGILRAAEIETDARVAFVREEGDRQSWFLAEGSFLRKGDADLFRAKGKVQGAGSYPAREATDLVCSAGVDVVFRAPGQATLNGAVLTGAREGDLIRAGTVVEAPVGDPPRAPGGPRFEIERP